MKASEAKKIANETGITTELSVIYDDIRMAASQGRIDTDMYVYTSMADAIAKELRINGYYTEITEATEMTTKRFKSLYISWD